MHAAARRQPPPLTQTSHALLLLHPHPQPDLDPKMRARQEAKLEELRGAAAEAARKELERKYALRYHKVRAGQGGHGVACSSSSLNSSAALPLSQFVGGTRQYKESLPAFSCARRACRLLARHRSLLCRRRRI